VALGDSLTSGHGIGAANAFPAILQRRLIEEGFDYEVVNAGVSGDTSAGAVRRLDRALAGDVRVLIVAIGINDGLRGLPVEQLRSNLIQVIDTAHTRGVTVLLCAMEAPPLYGWAYTTAFHNVYIEVAARKKVTLLPFVLMKMIGRSEFMLPDRMHPNAAGARAIAEVIWPYLRPVLRRTGSR
jgi:acyl-CoA thioesterase-1